MRLKFSKVPAAWPALSRRRAFTFPDLLVVIAVSLMLAAIVLPVLARSKATTKQNLCIANLKEVNRAVLLYAKENRDTLPILPPEVPKSVWWFYKDMVKGYAGLSGPSSPKDTKFGCPSDRGFTESRPFRYSTNFNYTSYVFNGVNLPGIPNIAGRQIASIKNPAKTLLTMEFPAHAPLSWHKSRTGKKNHPFYNDAENVVAFVDDHVKSIKIYYDGMNAAYTRDPVPGYEYQYSGD